MKKALVFGCCRALLLALAACGEIKVGDGIVPEDATADTVSDVGGTPEDTTPEVTAECAKDFECANMKGKTPCNVPSCDAAAGKCVLKAREVGEACTNPLDEAGECETATCDAGGACVKKPKAEGTKCGTNVCGKKCAAGQCVSTTEKDYDDKNPCTKDYCDQGNEIKHDPLTGLEFPCSDNDACSADDICVGGQCKGQAITCTDGILCTFDSCDKAKGCVFLADNKKCTDSDPCLNTACDLNEGCTTTTPKLGACNDGNACTTNDQCDKGVCKGKPDLAKCGCASDADCAKNNTLCGGKFKCVAATKVCELDADTVISCPAAADGCSTNTCNPTTGACESKPASDGKECDDDNLCTSDTKCNAGDCKGNPTSCDDKNPCTTDSCTPDAGCAHDPVAAPCDDGNKCTTDDICTLAGICAGAKKACDDNIACTYDGCDAATGNCSNAPQDKTCDDKNPCTDDKCAAPGGCQNKANDKAACDDGNTCTTDTCVSGACKSVNTCQCAAAGDCDDKNPCTSDACNAGKCTYTNAPSTQACDSGNKCMEANSGVCGNGVCTGGKPKACTGDACSSATCNPNTGSCENVPKADGTPCDADGNGCTTKDACKSGKCSPGAPATCISTDCAEVSCKSMSATTFECKSTPVAKGKDCDDSLFCTVDDACDSGGKCAGKPMVCDQVANPTGGPSGPANPCSPLVCNESIKACENKPLAAGSACEDGKFCTTNDKCGANGLCVGGAPPVCIGSGVCGQGFCDESIDKCGIQQKPGCCTGNADCDDGKPCTSDACTLSTNSCTYAGIPQCCNAVVFEDKFDDGKTNSIGLLNSVNPSQGWQVLAQSACPPGNPACAFPSGTFALYYGDDQAKNFNFGHSSGTATLPPLPSPGANAKFTLTFDLFMDTETGNAYDILSVEVVQAGKCAPNCASAVAWTKPGDILLKSWHKVTIDLSATVSQIAPLAGAQFAVVIRFDTKDQVANEGFGVLIDNLKIEGPPCGPPQG